ncbi:undecaprenyl-phosphate glucose phosphotransferase [Marinibactrum halimedae]|uniref:Undecaprenyl-phosphate glucose phosphotransferase n=1 Tax=Marinibactrum halimedae TaxID=1444977 RepID=A0AA37T798_9GAMM|nr:undecaprenyl-phosphate glucose phosphotransferase [Marinibactrum halimedae]MCD9458274.1 undecaprenyl-phosphate glucose phosphotransferase [Marinibactrum halimedae]GLS27099.1 undecaprenyl-phosphate glucose phosphotransferase [Marinibactrum halimedae]
MNSVKEAIDSSPVSVSRPQHNHATYKRLLQRHDSLIIWFEYAFYLLTVAFSLSLCLTLFGTEFTRIHSQLIVTTGLLMLIIYPSIGVGRRRMSGFQGVLRTGRAWGLVVLSLTAVGFFTESTQVYDRNLLGYWVCISLIMQSLIHYVLLQLQLFARSVRRNRSRTVIVGSGDIVYRLAERISDNVWLDENLIAVCDYSNSELSYSLPSKIKSVFNFDDLKQLIRNENIQRVYVALSLQETPQLMEHYNALKNQHVDVIWVPDIYEFDLLNHCIREISGLPLITLNETPLFGGSRALIKNVMDKCISGAVILLIAPLLISIAIAVKRSSPGPVIFRQERDGWNGKRFFVYKFRSMYVHEADHYVKQAEKNDDRITSVGRFIRRTSLDELPQLFNVLFGSMSLVGPRPHAVSHNNFYSEKISSYLARSRIKPGMTGLAQIRGFRGETREISDMESRVKSDLEYINRWSPILDIKILLLTPFRIFNKNAY